MRFPLAYRKRPVRFVELKWQMLPAKATRQSCAKRGYTLATLSNQFWSNQPISTCMIRYVQRCIKPAPAAAFIDYLIDSMAVAKMGLFASPFSAILCFRASRETLRQRIKPQ